MVVLVLECLITPSDNCLITSLENCYPFKKTGFVSKSLLVEINCLHVSKFNLASHSNLCKLLRKKWPLVLDMIVSSCVTTAFNCLISIVIICAAFIYCVFCRWAQKLILRQFAFSHVVKRNERDFQFNKTRMKGKDTARCCCTVRPGMNFVLWFLTTPCPFSDCSPEMWYTADYEFL